MMFTKQLDTDLGRRAGLAVIRASLSIAIGTVLVVTSGASVRSQSAPGVTHATHDFASYLGGSEYETARAVAIDGCGNIYVAGITVSTDFPIGGSPISALLRRKGGADAFVSKISADGSTLLFTAFIGGSGNDGARGVAVDALGAIYVTGSTSSGDFPTTHEIGDGNSPGDAFVVKIDPSGSSLVYSTRFGGENTESGTDIAVDAEGNAYITGQTTSDWFPVHNAIFPSAAYQDDLREEVDAFLAKLRPDGSEFVYATYLGGSGNDVGYGVDVDPSGNAYVSGSTYSWNFPEHNPFEASNLGGAFVTKVNPLGDTLIYSTTIGETGYIHDIAADADGNAYVIGWAGEDFPTTSNPFQIERNHHGDAYVAKIDPAGGGFVYSVIIGGSQVEHGAAVGVDSSGVAYIAGSTNSADFPFRERGGPGDYDTFVAAVSADGKTFARVATIGGQAQESGGFADVALAVDSVGNVVIAGTTPSLDFPVRNAFQTVLRGVSDVYVAKYSSGRLPAPMPAIAKSIVRPVKPYRLEIVGSAFQPGIQVFVGDDPTPLSARFKSCSKIRLKGADLEARFPIGVPVQLRVVNPDGGEATIQFIR